MRKTLLCALCALLFCLLLALPPRARDELRAQDEPPAQTEPPARDGPPAAEKTEARIRLLLPDGGIAELEMREYLRGVVAAEMPADFPTEALKAQAVAARSYALYCADGGKHGDAALCSDPGCCQAWQDEQARREKWGGDFERCEERIKEAVDATAGQVLLYEGAPVFAAFHSSSAGATEDCGAVWNPRPYLVSVSSPESAETVPGFISTLSCAPLDFRDTLLSARPEADFSGPEESWLGEIRLDGSGRVAEAVIGGAVFRGTELRSLFSLRSTAFTLAYAEGRFLFTVSGFGHGVGMSQYGAKLMAEAGAGYEEILAHYYPGTELRRQF